MTDEVGVADLPRDIYRVSKNTLRLILTKFNIRYRDDDTVAELRPIVADLKAFIKYNLTEEKRTVIRKLLGSKQYLSEHELAKYPQLDRIQKFLKDRENLYDNPVYEENQYENIDLEEEYWGDTESQTGSQLGIALEDQPPQIPRPPSPQENINVMSKEKLPLISAGTYHGLQSENPIDFINKYDIAAQSNHWKEATKLNLFPAHLTGTALTWYQHHTKGRNFDNWNDLKNTFIATFTPAAQAQTLQAILERKVQGRDQPVLAYYLEILTLCRRHDPEVADKQIIQYIIHGLRPEFCERVLTETCDTLEQLEQNLKKIELQLEIRALNREKYNRADRSGMSKDYTGTSRQEIDNLQAEIKNLTQIIANLNVESRNQQSEPHKTQRRGFYNDNYRRRETYYRGPAEIRPTQHHSTATAGWIPRHTAHRGGYRTYHNQQGSPQGHSTYPKHVTPTHGPRPRTQYAERTPRLCTVCKRTNHSTQDCRYKPQQSYVKRTAKYCDRCRMTNHSRDECYKIKNEKFMSKNA